MRHPRRTAFVVAVTGSVAATLFSIVFGPTTARAEQITMHVTDFCGQPPTVLRAITRDGGGSFALVANGTVSLDVPSGTEVGVTSYPGTGPVPPNVIGGPWSPAQNGAVLPTKCPDATAAPGSK
jgi:hypothetical protein